MKKIDALHAIAVAVGAPTSIQIASREYAACYDTDDIRAEVEASAKIKQACTGYARKSRFTRKLTKRERKALLPANFATLRSLTQKNTEEHIMSCGTVYKGANPTFHATRQPYDPYGTLPPIIRKVSPGIPFVRAAHK